MKYRLVHRQGNDPRATITRYTNKGAAIEIIQEQLSGARDNCVQIGCDVRDSALPNRPGFVAERDGKFYDAFEIVPVEATNGKH